MKYGALTIVAAATLALAGLSAFAQETTISGFSNVSAYLHAGPGNDFPVVAHVPPGSSMNITGCSQAFVWCDVTLDGNRGWIEGRYLDSVMNSENVNVAEFGRAIAVPTVSFDQRTYWRHNYRSYPFYSSPQSWNLLPQTPAESRATRYNSVDE